MVFTTRGEILQPISTKNAASSRPALDNEPWHITSMTLRLGVGEKGLVLISQLRRSQHSSPGPSMNGGNGWLEIQHRNGNLFFYSSSIRLIVSLTPSSSTSVTW